MAKVSQSTTKPIYPRNNGRDQRQRDIKTGGRTHVQATAAVFSPSLPVLSHSLITDSQLAGAQESAMETALLMKYIVTHAKFDTIHELISIIKAAGRKLVEAQPKGMCVSYKSFAYPHIGKEHTVGNIVRRILRLIREEWAAPTNKRGGDGDEDDSGSAMQEVSPKPTTYLGLDSGTRGNEPHSELLSSKATGANSQYSLSNFVLHGRPHREVNEFSSLFAQTSFPGGVSATSSKSAQSARPALVSAIEEVLDDLETVFDNVSNTAKDHIHSE